MAKPNKNNKDQLAEVQTRAAEVSKQVAKRSAKEARKAARRFVRLVGDTSKTLFGVGQRRVNRRNNRTTVGRYINDIISLAETSHLTGLKVDLSQILVEPRFWGLPEIIEPPREGEVVQEVFYVMPRMADFPEILAPYNLPSYRIPQLAVGNRRLVILGKPGSGRTTALMTIALWALRELAFEEKDDPVNQRIMEELEDLDVQERQKREQQRQQLLEAAREELESAIERGEVEKKGPTNAAEAFDADQEAVEAPLPAFTTLTPLYIHLGDLNITAREFGNEVDPAEPFMRALQRSVGTLTARTIPRMIYQRLENNQTLILMDGYDELPANEKKRVLGWLHGFLAQYGRNFIIMTGSVAGYGALVEQDFTPLFIKPWNPLEVEEMIDKWAEIFPMLTGTKRQPGPEITTSQKKRVAADSYAMTPAELTLKLWAIFHEGEDKETGYHISNWIENYIKSFLPEKEDYETMRPFLSNAAALQTDLGFLTRQGLEVLFKQQEESGAMTISQNTLAELDTDQDGVAETQSDDESDELDDEDDAAAERTRQLRTLIFSGLLRRYRGGRYRLRHSILADYYASLTLTDLPTTDPASLYDVAQKPNWKRPLMFAAQHTNMDDVVRMKLMAHPDFLHTELLELAQWLAYIPDEPAWRGEILKRLGNAFVHPNQFIANRERIACALVTSRDPEGALNIFEYGLGHEDVDVRRLSCLGAGAMGAHGQRLAEPIMDLGAAPEEEVQLAAIHAMGALRTQVTKHELAQIMREGEQRAQQAAAEVLASLPQDGFMALYDNVENEDMFVRRAAIFGIRRIETEWAQDIIRSRFMHERESFVHLLAQDSFLTQIEGLVGPGAPPTAEDVEWVQEWARGKRVNVASGKKSNVTLTRMLSEEDTLIRAVSAIATGQIGIAEAAKPLYNRLADPDPVVREAAYKALIDLQLRIGEPLPDPT